MYVECKTTISAPGARILLPVSASSSAPNDFKIATSNPQLWLIESNKNTSHAASVFPSKTLKLSNIFGGGNKVLPVRTIGTAFMDDASPGAFDFDPEWLVLPDIDDEVASPTRVSGIFAFWACAEPAIQKHLCEAVGPSDFVSALFP